MEKVPGKVPGKVLWVMGHRALSTDLDSRPTLQPSFGHPNDQLMAPQPSPTLKLFAIPEVEIRNTLW